MRLFFLIFFFCVSSSGFTQNHLWKDYFSYNNIRAISASSAKTYVATENTVFILQEGQDNMSIFNTVNGFKISDITAMAHSEEYKKIIVGSGTGLVVMIDEETGSIYTLSDIVSKTSLTDAEKVINDIYTYAGYAYLATGYGITAIRLYDAHFGDSYFIGDEGESRNVKNVTVIDHQLYANIEDMGIKRASINANMINYANWETYSYSLWHSIANFGNRLAGIKTDRTFNYFENNTPVFADSLYNGMDQLNTYGNQITVYGEEVIRVYNQYFNFVEELIFEGDTTGRFNTALTKNNNLLIGSNTKGLLSKNLYENNLTTLSPEGALSNDYFRIYNGDDQYLWSIYGGYDNFFNPYTYGLTAYGINRLNLDNNQWDTVEYDQIEPFRAMSYISVNPREPNYIYFGSFFDGMMKMGRNGNLADVQIQKFNQNNSGLTAIDTENNQDVRVNGPFFDNQGNGWLTNSLADRPLRRYSSSGEWQSYQPNVLTQNNNYTAPIVDRNNTKWFGAYNVGVVAFNEQNNRSATITNLPSNTVFSLALDQRNQLWIGTYYGIRVVPSPESFSNQAQIASNSIIIMEEGRAQELFYRQTVLKIKVDGSNNKWVSIAGAGVFLISDNGQNTIYRFDKDNSPLPDNDVVDIEINDQTGEVFFATKNGMVSFQNYATAPLENLSNVYVYPNPVRPEHADVINISGLSAEATIKITDVNGNLVYETRSLGGTVQWDTTNFSGSRVKTGVYMIFISSRDGSDTTVKKVMIVR